MPKKAFDGKHLEIYTESYDELEGEGILLCMGPLNLFISLEKTSELITGLNKIAYKSFQKRNEMFQ